MTDALDRIAHQVTYVDDGGRTLPARMLVERDMGRAPCSPYGEHPRDFHPVVLLLCAVHEQETGEPLTADTVDYLTSLVVNGSDDVAQALLNGAHYFEATPHDMADMIGTDRDALWKCPRCGTITGHDYCTNCHDDRRTLDPGVYVDGWYGQYCAPHAVLVLLDGAGWFPEDHERIRELAETWTAAMGPNGGESLTLDEEDELLEALDEGEEWAHEYATPDDHWAGFHPAGGVGWGIWEEDD